MLEEELVSVIMPVFNGEENVSESIESVIGQTYKNWELIIIDDASNDATHEKISSYHDSRIKTFKNEINLGPLLSRDSGQLKSKGTYIAFLDADDVWHEDKLRVHLNFMRKENTNFSYTDYTVFSTKGRKKVNCPKKYNLSNLMKNTGIALSSCIYKKNDNSFHFFGDHYPYTEHFFFLSVFSEMCVGKKCPHNLLYFRVHDSMSSNKIMVMKYIFNIYKDNHGFGYIISSFIVLRIMFSAIPRVLKKLFLINKL